MAGDIKCSVCVESWSIRGHFTIARGSKTGVQVLVVALSDNGVSGRGECVPYARYGESVEGVRAQITALFPEIEKGDLTHTNLATRLPAGAARNALDCAFWAIACQQSKQPLWQLIGQNPPKPVTTAYTLSLDTPEKMHAAAVSVADFPVLKLKLSGVGDLARIEAVRSGAPNAVLIVDANESWTVAVYQQLIPELVRLGVKMIEQPFSADQDDILKALPRPITVCADESCHDTASLLRLVGKYDMVNIKLDKTGGLTEALQVAKQARQMGFEIMVGCMVATSLSMAPAFFMAQDTAIVDLDGPLLLTQDRAHAMHYQQALLYPPSAALWSGVD